MIFNLFQSFRRFYVCVRRNKILYFQDWREWEDLKLKDNRNFESFGPVISIYSFDIKINCSFSNDRVKRNKPRHNKINLPQLAQSKLLWFSKPGPASMWGTYCSQPVNADLAHQPQASQGIWRGWEGEQGCVKDRKIHPTKWVNQLSNINGLQGKT